ncbi:MAG: serine hydrolase [Myxococcales bacterium]|nr:serine hydrolase [Myxococcales bacterium]
MTLLTLLAVGCDDPDPERAGEPLRPGSSLDALALTSCEPGTHPRVLDPDIDPEVAAGAEPGSVVCDPDLSCDALDCGAGECREGGGVASCLCPVGYDGASCNECAPGFGPDGEGRCAHVADAPAALASPLDPAATISDSGHRVQFGTCGAGAACADEIPMTGRVSPLFAEVDLAMQQFMKTRCAGSAVVSFSRKPDSGEARRVYKRGFGRDWGSATPSLAHCPEDDEYASWADYTLPDTPHQVGSVSKFVTAAVVREQIEDRIDATGRRWQLDDATEAEVLDPALELLPDELMRTIDQSRPDAQCPPIVGPGGCARSGCGGNGPDSGWQQMTIGDLLGHSAGLDGSVLIDWEDVITQTATLRDYDSWSDWKADNDALRARTKYPTALDSARDYLAGRLGVSATNVLFVNIYDAIQSEDPLDESLMVAAGRCLANTPTGQTQSAIDYTDYGYQNGDYAVLQRISAHLNALSGGPERFSSPNGFPELHAGSALDEFLTELDIAEGVVAEHSIQNRVLGSSPGLSDPVPQRREYINGTYTPTQANKSRPFCVWNGSECDFTDWADDLDNSVGLRLPWSFAVGYFDLTPGGWVWVNRPSNVYHFLNTEGRNPGVGGLMVEAPALLKIANLYYAKREDPRQGALREGCPNCSTTGYKGGDMGGARARVRQLVGTTLARSLPPRDGQGHLTLSPDPANWTDASWIEPAGVDFVVAVSQSADEAQVGGYDMERYVSYALSRVDWDAVDEMIEGQARTVVGMAMNSSGNTYLWFEDDHREVKAGPPALAMVDAAASADYQLPSTRIGSDLVGVGISNTDTVHGWYDDGHYSTGSSTNLDHTAHSYTLPPDQSYEDIVGLAFASDNRVYSWYRDGTRAIGTPDVLDYHGVASYTLPPGQTVDEIVDIAIDWANGNTVYTRFLDGSVAEGSSWNLDAGGYDRGLVAAMTMNDGDTTIWYANGYMRRMAGSPADNMVTPTLLESRQYSTPAGYSPGQIVGAAETDAGTRFWWATEETSWGMGTPSAMSYPNWPSTQVSQVADMARTTDGTVYSWYNTDARARGDIWDLGSEAIEPDFDASQSALNIVGMAIDSGAEGDGDVWVLYLDGAVSKGRSWDVGQTYWPAPFSG